MLIGKYFKGSLSGRKKIGAIAAIVLIGLAAVIRGLVVPAAEKWRTLSDRVSVRERELGTVYGLLQQRESLAAEWNKLRGAVSAPGKENAVDLVRAMEQWAA